MVYESKLFQKMKRLVSSKFFKFSELFIFYILFPFLTERKVFGEGQLNKAIPLFATFILFLIILLKDKDFNNKRFFKIGTYNWDKALVRFLVISVIGFFYVYFFQHDLLFNFAQEKPHKYFLFLLIYPIASVIPQELIYRLYFFHRYSELFNNEKQMVIFNAILFGYLHLIYDNWIAVVGATLIGLIFIYNYLKTKSLISVSAEHYAYGVMTFTLGLGKYFK